MRTHTQVLTLIAVLVWAPPLILAASSPAKGFAVSRQAEAVEAPAKPVTQEDIPGTQEAEPEKPHPGPKDIKEQVAIYVFLGWLWLSILVLIYVLRLKIRESDRLNNFAYFDTDKKTPPAQT